MTAPKKDEMVDAPVEPKRRWQDLIPDDPFDGIPTAVYPTTVRPRNDKAAS